VRNVLRYQRTKDKMRDRLPLLKKKALLRRRRLILSEYLRRGSDANTDCHSAALSQFRHK